MVAVAPAVIPVTKPEEFTDTSEGLLLLQVPPAKPLAASCMVWPGQTPLGPEIVPGPPLVLVLMVSANNCVTQAVVEPVYVPDCVYVRPVLAQVYESQAVCVVTLLELTVIVRESI